MKKILKTKKLVFKKKSPAEKLLEAFKAANPLKSDAKSQN
jgi:hypothetical protein